MWKRFGELWWYGERITFPSFFPLVPLNFFLWGGIEWSERSRRRRRRDTTWKIIQLSLTFSNTFPPVISFELGGGGDFRSMCTLCKLFPRFSHHHHHHHDQPNFRSSKESSLVWCFESSTREVVEEEMKFLCEFFSSQVFRVYKTFRVLSTVLHWISLYFFPSFFPLWRRRSVMLSSGQIGRFFKKLYAINGMTFEG